MVSGCGHQGLEYFHGAVLRRAWPPCAMSAGAQGSGEPLVVPPGSARSWVRGAVEQISAWAALADACAPLALATGPHMVGGAFQQRAHVWRQVNCD